MLGVLVLLAIAVIVLAVRVRVLTRALTDAHRQLQARPPTVIIQGDDGPAAHIQAPVSRVNTSTRSTTAFKHRPKAGTTVDELPLNDEQRVDVGTGRGCGFAIVGESYRQVALQELSAGRRVRGEEVHFIATLIPEPTNAYDPNAIRVDIQNGKQVGYLSRDDAAAYQLVIHAIVTGGKRAICRAKLIGGTTDKPSIGVMIDLDEPNALLARAPSDQPF